MNREFMNKNTVETLLFVITIIRLAARTVYGGNVCVTIQDTFCFVSSLLESIMLNFNLIHFLRVADSFDTTPRGRLFPAGPAFRIGLRTHQVFECSCGEHFVALLANVVHEKTKSCGRCNREGLRTITAFGRTLTIREWSAGFGVEASLINSRLGQVNWSNERIVSEPVNVRIPIKVEALGRSKTFSEWEKETGIPAYIIRSRINSGWHPEIAVAFPVEEYRGKKRGPKSVKEILRKAGRPME